MGSLMTMHSRFVRDMYDSSTLDSNFYTILPSFLFLGCMFILLYNQFHKYTTPFTRWKSRLYKNVIFHWAFFYISRIWFVVIKFAKYVIATLDRYVELNSPNEEIFINKILSHACVFMLLFTAALVPLMILSVQQIYRRHIPNFLMWVAEDPWVRSEIGTCGHYLDRPPQISPNYNNANSAYRSKRSTSVDHDITGNRDTSIPHFSRPCKSLMAFQVVKCIDDLVD